MSRPASPGEIAETLAQQHIEVDVLVNNAGFGAHGPIAAIGVERQLEMIEVNVAALTQLTALLLPGLLSMPSPAHPHHPGRRAPAGIGAEPVAPLRILTVRRLLPRPTRHLPFA